ncbi:phosphoribosyl-AMP cyclohydrolase [Deferribacteraceae bacterium V6Fe1]|nr:phosphoribosyl-AMP cyclohydrolase [Deferribacteraceae bacterium V6Fe1]
MIAKIDWEKMNGLVPVVVQDVVDKEVLMQAYADEQALKLTLETGFAHYYSRSRKSIWKKGETSGHLQKINKIYLDCDGDCLLYIVEQIGPACHTGKKTCFFNEIY